MGEASLKRPVIISVVFIVVVTVGTWIMDGMFAIMVSMLAVTWQTLRLLYHAVRRNIGGLQLAGVRWLLWAAAALVVGVVHGQYSDRARAQGDALVAALQAYRAREGRYPDKLEALAPKDIAAIPAYGMSPFRENHFHYRSDGKFFSMFFITGFRMGAHYDSGTGKWQAMD